MRAAFRKYLVPGFVFQSVVIAGGYGTGRELVEFFLVHGPVAGLVSMVAVSMLIWSAVCAVTFEFARTFRAYDYRHLFRRLLGPGWVAYEALYGLILLLVLAVIAAAAGTILAELFELPYWVGVTGIMAAVGLVVLGGTEAVERTLATWSLVLYACYIVFVAWSFARFGDSILARLADVGAAGAAPGPGAPAPAHGWVVDGIRYAAYNLSIIPALGFVTRHAERRRDTIVAGILAGVIAMVPAVLFYLAMLGQYPAILERPVPANYVLDMLGSRGFQLVFQLVLFGTLIETGAGMIHAVNERIAGAFADRGAAMPRVWRPVVALLLLAAGAALARFGLIDLIARGYGTITWGFLAIYVVPMLTLGVWKLRRADAGEPA